MKKTFTILLLLLFCGWVNAQTYSGGSGTLAAPYKIATLADLQYLDGHTGDWGKFFIQTATINASATATWNSGLGWLPIGNTTTKFTGTYDGQGYIIDHLTLNRPSDYNHGFFGYTLVASIKNVNLENISIIGGTMALNTPTYEGGLIGFADSTIVTLCYSKGTLSRVTQGNFTPAFSQNRT